MNTSYNRPDTGQWEWNELLYRNRMLNSEEKEVVGILLSHMWKSIHSRQHYQGPYEILEPGAGKGTIADYLVRLPGVSMHLTDTSSNSVQGLSRIRFPNQLGKSVFTYTNDVRDLCFSNNQFDLVWNYGVMEHFEDSDLEKGITEMARVSRDWVIVLVPNANCFPYMEVKHFMETHGTWQWGLERPKTSLREVFQKANLDVSAEYTISRDDSVIRFYGSHVPPAMRQALSVRWNKRQPHPMDGMTLVTIGRKKSANNL